jgi:hypothetical protein
MKIVIPAYRVAYQRITIAGVCARFFAKRLKCLPVRSNLLDHPLCTEWEYAVFFYTACQIRLVRFGKTPSFSLDLSV